MLKQCHASLWKQHLNPPDSYSSALHQHPGSTPLGFHHANRWASCTGITCIRECCSQEIFNSSSNAEISLCTSLPLNQTIITAHVAVKYRFSKSQALQVICIILYECPKRLQLRSYTVLVINTVMDDISLTCGVLKHLLSVYTCAFTEYIYNLLWETSTFLWSDLTRI